MKKHEPNHRFGRAQRRRLLAASVAAVLALTLAACEGEPEIDEIPESEPNEQDAAPEPEPLDEPEDDDDVQEEPADPYAVPDEITTVYVSAVVDELFRLNASTTRTARADLEQGETLPDELIDELYAIYTEDRYLIEATNLQRYVDEGFPDFPDEFGQARFEAEVIIEDSDRCLVAQGILDISETAMTTFEEDPRRADSNIVLVPIRAEQDPRNLNPTPWVVATQVSDPDLDEEFYAEFCS